MINGTKQFITNSGTDITELVTVTAVTGERRRPPGDLRDPGAERHPGFHRRAGLRQGRLAHLGHASADLRRRARARGEPAGRARSRIRGLPGSWTRAVSRSPRCASARRRAASKRHPVRQGAAGVRSPDRQQPAHRVQDRPDAGPRSRRAARLLRRRRRMVAGQPFKMEAASPNSSAARPRWTTPATRPRSSAATAS